MRFQRDLEKKSLQLAGNAFQKHHKEKMLEFFEGPAPNSKSSSGSVSRRCFLSNLTNPMQKIMTSLKLAKPTEAHKLKTSKSKEGFCYFCWSILRRQAPMNTIAPTMYAIAKLKWQQSHIDGMISSILAFEPEDWVNQKDCWFCFKNKDAQRTVFTFVHQRTRGHVGTQAGVFHLKTNLTKMAVVFRTKIASHWPPQVWYVSM